MNFYPEKWEGFPICLPWYRQGKREFGREELKKLKKILWEIGFHSFFHLRSLWPKDRSYRFGGFEISAPRNHRLGLYRKVHPTYDQFLPTLAACLPPDSWVIDVGANIGDTMSAMWDKNRSLSFLCIEPDIRFFKYLSSNSLKTVAPGSNSEIRLEKALVGSGAKLVDLVGDKGTRKAIESSSGEFRSERLDDICSKLKISSNITLLKSDVDGFDWDVLDSARDVIKANEPMLFFECQFDTVVQFENFKITIKDMSLEGYGNWAVFDNFGKLVLQTTDHSAILSLMNYSWGQKTDLFGVKIDYLDIFTWKGKDDILAQAALVNFSKVMGD